MTVFVRVSEKVAQTLTVGQQVAVIETMQPNETALSVLGKHEGVVLVFDHGYLSTRDGFFLGKEPPLDIPLEDKMIVTNPKVGEGKRSNLVSQMIQAIQKVNGRVTNEEGLLTLYLVGEPTAIWGAIVAAGEESNIDVVYVLHSEADYGDAIFDAIRPDPEKFPEIAYHYDLDNLPAPRSLMDRVAIKWNQLAQIEDREMETK